MGRNEGVAIECAAAVSRHVLNARDVRGGVTAFQIGLARRFKFEMLQLIPQPDFAQMMFNCHQTRGAFGMAASGVVLQKKRVSEKCGFHKKTEYRRRETEFETEASVFRLP